MELCNISVIRSLMEDAGITFRRDFGQNFLINRMIPEDIADNCADTADRMVLEIGPGIGSLTQELALRYSQVVAVEIDNGLIPVLKYTLGSHANVKVVNEDVMKCNLGELLAPAFERGGVSVCANLPYYITTPILMMLLESHLPFDYITIMIQAEVADRLCAPVGGKDCGAITAILNYYGMPEKLFTVSSDRFIPEPKVDSAVVRIKLHKDKPYKPLDEATFFKTVRGAFEQRRKTLPNSLSAVFTELSKDELTEITVKCGHNPSIRGERLTMTDLCDLSDELYKKTNQKA